MTDKEIEYARAVHALNKAWFRSIARQGTPSRLSWPHETANGRWCYDYGHGHIVYPRRRK